MFDRALACVILGVLLQIRYLLSASYIKSWIVAQLWSMSSRCSLSSNRQEIRSVHSNQSVILSIVALILTVSAKFSSRSPLEFDLFQHYIGNVTTKYSQLIRYLGGRQTPVVHWVECSGLRKQATRYELNLASLKKWALTLWIRRCAV